MQTARELRGIPLVGGHRSSAIPGTDPLPATIGKDEAGRLFPSKRERIERGREILAVHYERRGRPLARSGVVDSDRFFKGR